MRGWTGTAAFFVNNVLLLTVLALAIVIIDRWLMEQRFFVDELLANAMFLLVSTTIFLLFLQSPVQWLLRNSSFTLALTAGLAIGVTTGAVIDYWVSGQEGLVLCRRFTMYVTLSSIGAIFSFNFQRRVRPENLLLTSGK